MSNYPPGTTERDISGPPLPHCVICNREFQPDNDHGDCDCTECEHCEDCLPRTHCVHPDEADRARCGKAVRKQDEIATEEDFGSVDCDACLAHLENETKA